MKFKRIKVLLVVIFLSLIIMSINVNSAFVIKDTSELINAFSNDNLVRLHVIANTNSPKDQYIKRLIREKVNLYMKEYVENKKNGLNKEFEYLEKYIETVLEKEGVGYKAKVEFGKYYFPARTYNNTTLPAGTYKALKVILGKGEGSNWWCVLLPPMCIEEVKTNNDEGIEIRLKIVEWIKGKKKNRMKYTLDKEIVSLEDKFAEIKLNSENKEYKLIDVDILNSVIMAN